MDNKTNLIKYFISTMELEEYTIEKMNLLGFSDKFHINLII